MSAIEQVVLLALSLFVFVMTLAMIPVVFRDWVKCLRQGKDD